MKQNRVDRIMAALKEMGLHQMLIVDPMSIYYLTGVYVSPFERFYGLYLREDGHHAFFLNRLFTVPQEVGIEKVWYSDTDPAMEIVARYLDKDAPLGVDKELKARFLLPLMEMKAAAGFVNASLAVDNTRGIKDEEEQELQVGIEGGKGEEHGHIDIVHGRGAHQKAHQNVQQNAEEIENGELVGTPLPLQGVADEVVEVEGDGKQENVSAGGGDKDKGNDPPDLPL